MTEIDVSLTFELINEIKEMSNYCDEENISKLILFNTEPNMIKLNQLLFKHQIMLDGEYFNYQYNEVQFLE